MAVMVAPSALESYFLSLINNARANAGVSPLGFDGELLNSSDAHTAWMDSTDTFSHTGVNGSSPAQRMSAAGYGWSMCGENIAYVSGPLTEASVSQLFQNLMNSSGHRANILQSNFQEIGIGLKEGTINGRTVVFVTQNFGKPNATEQAEPNDVATGTPAPPQPLPDTFETFTFATQSAANGASISTWNKGDTIDLSGIDADMQQSGNQAFRVVSGFSLQGDELTFRQNASEGETYIYGNTDHDRNAEFKITVQGLHTFGAADFIL